MNITD